MLFCPQNYPVLIVMRGANAKGTKGSRGKGAMTPAYHLKSLLVYSFCRRHSIGLQGPGTTKSPRRTAAGALSSAS
eukprot:34881_2